MLLLLLLCGSATSAKWNWTKLASGATKAADILQDGVKSATAQDLLRPMQEIMHEMWKMGEQSYFTVVLFWLSTNLLLLILVLQARAIKQLLSERRPTKTD